MKNACVVIVKGGTQEKRKIFSEARGKNTLFSWGGALDYHQSEVLTLWPVFFCFLHRQVSGIIIASSVLEQLLNARRWFDELRVYRNLRHSPHPSHLVGWVGGNKEAAVDEPPPLGPAEGRGARNEQSGHSGQGARRGERPPNRGAGYPPLIGIFRSFKKKTASLGWRLRKDREQR